MLLIITAIIAKAQWIALSNKGSVEPAACETCRPVNTDQIIVILALVVPGGVHEMDTLDQLLVSDTSQPL